ncbi:hypothetical protein Tco_1574175 [Tanacetum coccineum]
MRTSIQPRILFSSKIQNNGFRLEYGELRKYTHGFLSNVAELLKDGMIRYLPYVVPLAFYSSIGAQRMASQMIPTPGLNNNNNGNSSSNQSYMNMDASNSVVGIFVPHLTCVTWPLDPLLPITFTTIACLICNSIFHLLKLQTKEGAAAAG